MRLLLDTAVLIHAAEAPHRLSQRAASALEDLDNLLELSAVSMSEIAIKTTKGKLEFPAITVRQALDRLDIRVVPYTADHAFRLFELPLHHTDPFDRQIIAQALCEKITVITPDEKFGLYEGLEILW